MSSAQKNAVANHTEEDDGEDSGDETKCEWSWNDKDKGKFVKLDESKLTATFHEGNSACCSAVRGSKPLVANMQHYFEVVMKSPFHGQARQVGIGTKHTPLESSSCDFYPLLGKDLASWGLNYTGRTYFGGEWTQYIKIDPDKHKQLQIGVHYDAYYGTISFDVNGVGFGVAFTNIVPTLELYPMVCVSAADTVVELVQCSSTLMPLKALCRGTIRMEVKDEKNFDDLPLPDSLKAYIAFRSTKRKQHGHVVSI